MNKIYTKGNRFIAICVMDICKGQPIPDNRRIFIAMTDFNIGATNLVSVPLCWQLSSVVKYNPICLCSWNFATNGWEIDNWKNKVITFVVKHFFNPPPLSISR
jgi:hypothetical protein